MEGILKLTFNNNETKIFKNTIGNSFAFSTHNLYLYASNSIGFSYPDNSESVPIKVPLNLIEIKQLDSTTSQLHYRATINNDFQNFSVIGIYDNELNIRLTYVDLSSPLTGIKVIDYFITIPKNDSPLFTKEKLSLWINGQLKIVNLFDNQFPLSNRKNIEFWNVLDTTYIKALPKDSVSHLLFSILTPDLSNNLLNGYIFLENDDITTVHTQHFPTVSNNFYLTDFYITDYSHFNDFTTLTPEKSYQNDTLTGTYNFDITEFEPPIPNLGQMLFMVRIISPYNTPTLQDSSTMPLYFVKPYNDLWGNDNTNDIISTDIQLANTPPTTIQKYYQSSQNLWTINNKFLKIHPLWNEILIDDSNLKFASYSEEEGIIAIIYNDNSYKFIDAISFQEIPTTGSIDGNIIGVWKNYIFTENSNFNIYDYTYNWDTSTIDIKLFGTFTKEYGEILDSPHNVISLQNTDNGANQIVFLFNNNRQLYTLDVSSTTWTAHPYYLANNTYPYFSDDIFVFANASDTINIDSLVTYLNYYEEKVVDFTYSFTTAYTPSIPPYLNTMSPNESNKLIVFYNENENQLYMIGTNYNDYSRYYNNATTIFNYWTKTYSTTKQYIYYPVPVNTIPLLLVDVNGTIDIFAPSFSAYYDNGNYVLQDSSIFWDISPSVNWNGDTPYPTLPQDKNENIIFENSYWVNNDILIYKLTNFNYFAYTDINHYIQSLILYSLGNIVDETIQDITITGTDTTIPHNNSKICIYKVIAGKMETAPDFEGSMFRLLQIPITYIQTTDLHPNPIPNSLYVQTYPPFHIYYVDSNGNVTDNTDIDTLIVYWFSREPATIDWTDTNLIYDIDLSKLYIKWPDGWYYPLSLNLTMNIFTYPALTSNLNNAIIFNHPAPTININNTIIFTN